MTPSSRPSDMLHLAFLLYKIVDPFYVFLVVPFVPEEPTIAAIEIRA